ncbi:hypothetical protein MAPG_01821 [Magnaporthiopsis poae ATCC 64411]|uniref:3-oxoacyl-[acyl-carrier-protein] reductase n=1 Tax=Magnaporthiopsis poae (strain ATCC 64411 / 73-15) TaxID=644358 RepID=A0A0C4DPQ0_MAGP6|nr:hypothetical protein MAPG_01821 [Magnaporthiopsis poae ATCC 64411]
MSRIWAINCIALSLAQVITHILPPSPRFSHSPENKPPFHSPMSSAAKTLLGKVAVVTGAASGNGRSIAVALADAGATVVCSDLQPAARQDGYEKDTALLTHDAITQAGGRAVFHRADVAIASDVEGLVDAAVKEFGRLDIMVNNAGIFTGTQNILELSIDDYDRTMAINTRGTYLGCRYAIQQFLAQSPPPPPPDADHQQQEQEQRPIGRSSTSPPSAGSFLPTAMVRSLLDNPETHKAIRDATPWPRLGTAKDVTDAVLFLAGSQSDWMTGSALTVDGGYTAK